MAEILWKNEVGNLCLKNVYIELIITNVNQNIYSLKKTLNTESHLH